MIAILISFQSESGVLNKINNYLEEIYKLTQTSFEKDPLKELCFCGRLALKDWSGSSKAGRY